MESKLNFWIRYLFPVFLALFLGTLIFMTAQFREPPEFAWQAVIWFIGSIFLIWESGWWVSNKLNKNYAWRDRTFQRLLIQLVITNLIGMAIFLGSFILLNWYETQVRGSLNSLGWLHIVVVLGEAFIIVQIINSVQIGYQLLGTWQAVELESEAYKKETAITHLEKIQQQIDPQYLDSSFDVLKEMLLESPEKVSAYLKELSDGYTDKQSQLATTIANVQQTLQKKNTTPSEPQLVENKKIYKSRFLVRSGTRMFLIPIEDVALFYKDEIVLLFTKKGKKYPVDHSLEEINTHLNPLHFFRINRQYILHDRYVGEMKMEGNQLLVNLIIPFPKTLSVSQRNVSHFKRWLNEDVV